MPQPLPPTLSELRRSVAVRSGLSASLDANARHRELIDEFLRKAQREIYLRAGWARLRRDYTFSAVTGQTDYDLPDATTVGGIILLEILNLAGTPQPVIYDDSRDLQALTRVSANVPQFWRIVDDVLRVLPAPDADNYPTFQMEYELAPQPLVNDQDRPAVDGEAMIQHATIAMKRQLGTFQDVQSEEKHFIQYLNDLRGQVNPGRMYGMASRDWQGPVYVRLNSYPTGAGTGPYNATWAPWF